MARLERGKLREALLKEVKEVCATDGPEAVSISKIGKQLGVSSGAPFRLFPSREHIFAALIEAEMERLDQTFAEIWSASNEAPAVRLALICTAYLDHAKSDPAMFRLAFSVSAKAMGASNLQVLGEDVYGKVRAAVAACLEPQAAPKDIEAKTYILWSTIHGHALLQMTGQMDDLNVQVSDSVVIGSAIQHILD